MAFIPIFETTFIHTTCLQMGIAGIYSGQGNFFLRLQPLSCVDHNPGLSSVASASFGHHTHRWAGCCHCSMYPNSAAPTPQASSAVPKIPSLCIFPHYMAHLLSDICFFQLCDPEFVLPQVCSLVLNQDFRFASPSYVLLFC